MSEGPLLILDADHKPVQENIELLGSALQKRQYRNLPVKVVSATGMMQCGKSTMMNLFMRQLRAHETTRQPIDELGTPLRDNTELDGFPWGAGRRYVPHGVYIWSRPFIVSDGNGHESAVLLMDVEGAFDRAGIERSTLIFVFAALVSSAVLLNVEGIIDELVIQLLDHFVATGNTPLQDVTIVVRDFMLAQTFGFEPGNELLEEMMEVTDPTDKAIQTSRGRIRQFAPDLSCFLMPHPGLEAAEQNDWRDARPKFLSCISDLLCAVIRHPKLVGKQPLKCANFITFMEPFFTAFTRDQQPPPKTLFDAMQESTNLVAFQRAEDGYRRDIRSLADRIGLKKAHEQLQEVAIGHLQHVQLPKVREQLTIELKAKLEEIRTTQEEIENMEAKNKQLRTTINAAATSVAAVVAEAAAGAVAGAAAGAAARAAVGATTGATPTSARERTPVKTIAAAETTVLVGSIRQQATTEATPTTAGATPTAARATTIVVEATMMVVGMIIMAVGATVAAMEVAVGATIVTAGATMVAAGAIVVAVKQLRE